MLSPLTLAVSAWLLLGFPLYFYTLVVEKHELGLGDFSGQNITSAIRIAVTGDYIPDIAKATEYVLNQKKSADDRVFIVDDMCTEKAELCVHAKMGKRDALGLDSGSTNLEIEFSEQTMVNGKPAEVVALLILDHVYSEVPETHQEVTASYAPHYHLTFSLFSEGGEVIQWDAGAGIEATLGPLLSDLRYSVANLTVDTQRGLYASLSDYPIGNDTLSQTQNRVVNRSRLTNFVDFAEWPLASSSPAHALNFVLYLPSTGLEIEGSATNSFIIPQWGGVVVAPPLGDGAHLSSDQLESYMDTFARQLLALLGMREPHHLSSASKPAVEVRLAELSRFSATRGLKAAASSLDSLKRIASNMPNIPIPKQVAERAQQARRAYDAGIAALARADHALATQYAAEAFKSAESAFFDRHMVAQAYFPDEHKLAVYMPLIGPLCVVVVSGWVRALKAWKAKKTELVDTSKAGKKVANQ